MQLRTKLGAAAALLYAIHAADLASRDSLAQLGWAHSVAAAFVAIGLVMGLPGVNAVGGTMIVLGGLLRMAAIEGGPPWVSVIALAGVAALSLAGTRVLGFPRQTWWRAVVAIAAVTMVTGWLTETGNINYAVATPSLLTGLFGSHGAFVLTALSVLAIAALAVQLAVVQTGLARSTGLRLGTPDVPALVAPPRGVAGAAPSEPPDPALDVIELPIVKLFAKHVNPTLIKLLGILGSGRLFVRARDVWLWDHQGRRYLDCLSGASSVNIGHNHPRMGECLQRLFASEVMNFLPLGGPSEALARLGARVASMVDAPLERIIPTNGGSEAVEAGMKIARFATGRKRLVYCAGSYHGSTLGAMSLVEEGPLREGLLPLLPECVRIPFGDLKALAAVLATDEVAGVVIDPGLCESALVNPPPGFLKAAQALCRAHGTLLILDEIQTGLGRMGTLFLYQEEGFVPDVLLFAKSLSGAIAPIGLAVTSAEIHDRAVGSIAQIDAFASTFGGNSFSCTAAVEALDIIEAERLVDNSRARGEQLLAGLRERLRGHPLVADVRGRGLMVVVELGVADPGWLATKAPALARISGDALGLWATVHLLERGLLCQPGSFKMNVVKLMPALTIQEREVQWIIDTFGAFLDEYREPAVVLGDVTARLAGQALAGWSY